MPQSPERAEGEGVGVETVEANRVEEDPTNHDGDTTSNEPPVSRPVTRSQTGRVAKRRHPESGPEGAKRTAPKKTRTQSRQASATEEAEEVSTPGSAPKATDPPPDVSSAAGPAPEMLPPSTSRITFLEVATAADAQGDRRISRSRAVFPVPVPNLTKKSRGRRVPTTQTIDPAVVQPEKRVYICKVDGCGKCFHRGEHLKRHIRSIHTHEKPFKCSFPQCEKFFNRHDNLLQHLKVHRETKPGRSQKTSADTSNPGTPSPSRPPSPSQSRDLVPSTLEVPESPVVPRPRTIYDHQPNLYAGYINTGPFESPAESMRFVTNMAVSSLRTEIPQSPTEPRQATFPWHPPEPMKDQLTY